MGEVITGDEEFPDIGGRKFNAEIEEFEYLHLRQFRIALKDVKKFNCPMNDSFLIRFLRAKKYDIQAATKVVEKYFNLRRQNLDLTTVPFTSYTKVYDTKMIYVCKHRENGRKIFCFRVNQWDPQYVTADELSAAVYVMFEEMSSVPETQRKGMLFILDASELTVSRAKAIVRVSSIRQMKRIVAVFQGAFPSKNKGIFGVNIPYLINGLFIAMKGFLKSKLRSRIHLSSSGPESLQGHISENILPTFLGGKLTFEEAEDLSYFKSVIDNETYYRALEKYVYNPD